MADKVLGNGITARRYTAASTQHRWAGQKRKTRGGERTASGDESPDAVEETLGDSFNEEKIKNSINKFAFQSTVLQSPFWHRCMVLVRAPGAVMFSGRPVMGTAAADT